MDSITLKYGSGVGAYAKTFSVANANLLYVRGLDDVDELRFWPAIQNQLLDGSMVENVSKFGRTITVNFGVIPVKADRVWLAMWMIGTSKVLSVAAEEIPVVLGSLDGFANEWVDGFELAKSFTVVCKEVSVTSSQPASWA